MINHSLFASFNRIPRSNRGPEGENQRESNFANTLTARISGVGRAITTFGTSMVNRGEIAFRMYTGLRRITDTVAPTYRNLRQIGGTWRQMLQPFQEALSFLTGRQRHINVERPEAIEDVIVEELDLIDEPGEAIAPQEVNTLVVRISQLADRAETFRQITSTLANNPIPFALATAVSLSATGPILQQMMRVVSSFVEHTTNPACQALSCVIILATAIHLLGNTAQLNVHRQEDTEGGWVIDFDGIRAEIALEENQIRVRLPGQDIHYTITHDIEGWELLVLRNIFDQWTLVAPEEVERDIRVEEID